MELTKNQKRHALWIILANTIDEDWMEDTNAINVTQSASKLIGDDCIGSKRPLPSIDFEKMNRKKYFYLISQGYMAKEIFKVSGLNKNKYSQWLRDNMATKYHRRDLNLKMMNFSDEDMTLPVREV